MLKLCRLLSESTSIVIDQYELLYTEEPTSMNKWLFSWKYLDASIRISFHPPSKMSNILNNRKLEV